MKPTLDIQLIGLSENKREQMKEDVEKAIEKKEDVWPEMLSVNEHQDEEGQWILFIRTPFYKVHKRDEFKVKVMPNIQGVWNQCEAGSYVALHTCDHDEGARQGCKIEKIVKK